MFLMVIGKWTLGPQLAVLLGKFRWCHLAGGNMSLRVGFEIKNLKPLKLHSLSPHHVFGWDVDSLLCLLYPHLPEVRSHKSLFSNLLRGAMKKTGSRAQDKVDTATHPTAAVPSFRPRVKRTNCKLPLRPLILLLQGQYLILRLHFIWSRLQRKPRPWQVPPKVIG